MKSRATIAFLLATLVLAGCVNPGKPAPVPEKKAAPPLKKEAPAGPLQDPTGKEMTARAPDIFKAMFVTSKGDFTIVVHRELSPHGADRFYNLVRAGYYDGVRFFRVLPGFMAQFGMHGDPKLSFWLDENIPADPVLTSNRRGTLTYAMGGSPTTRSVQLFINYGHNARLDGMGFAPFGAVAGDGMSVVDRLYSGYGEGAPRGRGPSQGRIAGEGNRYLDEEFPKLDFIVRASIVE